MPRPRKALNLDFAALDQVLDSGGRVDLKSLATQHSTCPPVIRRVLREHYGDSIVFKIGRNGGVRRANLVSPNKADMVSASI